VVVAALAVQLAVVMGPWVLVFGLDGVKWGALSFFLPALLVVGLWRQSPWILLAAVPVAWALPAHGLPPGALAGQVGAVALLAVAAYVPTALAWLRPQEPSQAEVAWVALDDDPSVPVRRPLPWVAGLVVALPAVGVALWPTMSDAVVRGFPGMVRRAHVALTLMVLLVGLGLATDLARGRSPLRGKSRKIMVLGAIGVVTLLGGLLAH